MPRCRAPIGAITMQTQRRWSHILSSHRPSLSTLAPPITSSHPNRNPRIRTRFFSMFRPPQCLAGHVRHTFPGDLETPKVKQPEPTSGAELTAVAPVTPMLPQEIIDEILGLLAPDPDAHRRPKHPLRYCSLVSKSWVESCRRHMFRKLSFDARRMWKWLHVFPVPEQSPGHHVKRVHITPRETDHVLPKIIERFHGFPKLKTISVGRDGRRCTSWTSQFVGLPQFVTSLRLTEDSITLWQIRGCYKSAAQLRLFISLWGHSCDGQERGAGDGNDPDGQIRWTFGILLDQPRVF